MILVTTHDQADFDCAAGVLAARLLHPGATIAFPGAKLPALHAYLRRWPDLLPERRAKDIDLDAVRTLILVDTQSPERLGRFAALLGRPQVELLVYDHHPRRPSLPAGARVEVAEVGAVASLLARRLRESGVPVTPPQATLLLLGIYEDTGGLLYAGTRPEDFQAAAWLVGLGGELGQVAEVLARGLTPPQVDLYHALLHDARPHEVAGREVFLAAAEGRGQA
jgi:tRNA nucleotidyltransferase (CCA-adding enzyme)